MKETASGDLLAIEIEPIRDGTMLVRLKGEIDISSAHLLTAQLSALSTGNTHSSAILDATEVSFMDSTGLHALVEGKKVLHDKGTRVFLIPSRQVRRVLELVFPDPLYAFRMDSVDEALAALDGHGGEEQI